MQLSPALQKITKEIDHSPTRREVTITLERHQARTDPSLAPSCLERLNKNVVGLENKKLLLFFCHYPLPNIIRQSIILRETGRFHTALIAFCIREEFRLENFFDLVFECPSYWAMAQIFASLDKELPRSVLSRTHLQCVCGPAIIPALAGLFSNLPFILELYDTILVYWDDLANNSDYHLERLAVHKAAGIIHKYPRSGHQLIQEHYNFERPCLQFYAYPLQEFTVPGLPPAPQDKEPPRLVFAGGLMPPVAARRFGHTNHLMFDLIHQVTSVGLKFTIYANQNAKDMRWHRQAEYFLMQKRHPGFTLKAGLPFWRIPRAMRRHHFCLFYDNLKKQRYNKLHFKELMPTKFFTYLESGLPIIVYPQISYVHQLVLEYGLGISYDPFQPATIAPKIKEAHYVNLTQNIASFREKIWARDQISHLLAFHELISAGLSQSEQLDTWFPLG